MATKIRDHSYQRLSKDWKLQKEGFEDQVIVVEPTKYAKSKIYLAILNNQTVEAKYKSQHILLIVLEGIYGNHLFSINRKSC